MLQRSGEALYSNCADDKPWTCSPTICVVISKCTRRCSRSSLVMGAANSGTANRQIVSMRTVQFRSIYVRSAFIIKSIARSFRNTHLDDQTGERLSSPAQGQFPSVFRRWSMSDIAIFRQLRGGLGSSRLTSVRPTMRICLTRSYPPLCPRKLIDFSRQAENLTWRVASFQDMLLLAV